MRRARALCISLAMVAAVPATATSPGVDDTKEGTVAVHLIQKAGYKGSASGDALSPDGATAALIGDSADPEAFGSTISTIELEQSLEKVVIASAVLSVKGPGQGILWLRAHDDDRRLLYANTMYLPVEERDGTAERRLVVNVPRRAKRLFFGVALKGRGELNATALRARFDPELALQRTTDAEVNLQAAVSAIKENALHADRISWDSMQTSLDVAKNMGESYQNYPVYRRLLAQLGDGHSFMLAPHDAELGRRSTRSVEPYRVEVASGGVGYVKIPGISGGDTMAAELISTEIQADICAVSATVVSWIVDLRSNTGGNMWPMLRSLSPFLSRAGSGAFVDRNGDEKPWVISGEPQCDLKSARVAVLVGSRTSSSGELTAIAFKGRQETRFFGEPSSGRATSNRSVELPDGARLLITNARAKDRAGKFHERIVPDQIASDEEAILSATEWLMEKR